MITNLSDTLIEVSYACAPSFKEAIEQLRGFARNSDRASRLIDVETAHLLGEPETRDRLLRDTLALCNYLEIIAMLSAHIKDDVYRLKKAQQFYENQEFVKKRRAVENELRREKKKIKKGSNIEV